MPTLAGATLVPPEGLHQLVTLHPHVPKQGLNPLCPQIISRWVSSRSPAACLLAQQKAAATSKPVKPLLLMEQVWDYGAIRI